MATFKYEALTVSGRLMTGTMEASSPEEARALLEGMQLSVRQIDKARPEAPKGAIGRDELILLNQQLASLAEAHLQLEGALRELAADAASRRMRRLIQAVADDLESGADFREVFEKHRGSFPPLYGQVVEAGVRSGRLGEMLRSLNRHTEVASRTRRILREACSYPVTVLAFSLAVVTAVLVFIVPLTGELIADMYRELRGDDPPVTSFLMMLSNNIGWIWIGIASAIVLFIALKHCLALFAGGRRFKELVLMSVPGLGRIYRDAALGRMADSLALLVGAGCDMPSCLRMAGAASGSELLRADAEMLAKGVEEGKRLLDCGLGCKVIPGLFLYSAEVGSQRNDLSESLYALSEMYFRQVRSGQGRLQAMLLPALLIILGGVIALLIAAVFLPLVESMRGVVNI